MYLIDLRTFALWFLNNLQLLRPIYRQIAENQNAEIFSANTLLVILGTSLLTARVGVIYSSCIDSFIGNLLSRH